MDREKSLAVKTTPKKAENTLQKLKNRKLLRTDLKVKKDKKHVYFPIQKKPTTTDFNIVTSKFEKLPEKKQYYKDKINIPEEQKKLLPTSYDIIGKIILVKIPDELQQHKKEIGKALLKSHKNVETVYISKPVEGELRTRNVEIIAGENKTETIHVEHGVKIKLDIEKTYFSPRLANERKHVARQVKTDETIVDMFTGVAPFPLVINHYSNPKKTYGIDKNPLAVKYANFNIKINKFKDKIKIFHGDAENINEILPSNVEADRVIMNLPFSSYKFLPAALKIMHKKCIFHYYEMIKEGNIDKRINLIKKTAKKNNVYIENIDFREIKSYSPREFYIGFDITAKKTK
ncbi:MAG: class I SAM-dependent methyltransferase family protein [Candidatus Thermoplasmatota archaeon]